MANVIGIINAGKMRYGVNNWFWASWYNIEIEPNWNGQKPIGTGFENSEVNARNAALHVLATQGVNSQIDLKNNWARAYLSKQEEQDQRPNFSRCQVGKNKWLWVIHSIEGICNDEEPVARGFAASPEAAHDCAVAVVGPVRQCGNWMAEYVRKKDAAVRRNQKRARTDNTALIEFVYECHRSWSDFGGFSHSTIPHRIVKKTKKRIYVESEPHREGRQISGDWRDYGKETFILDRSEFEATGKAKRSGRWYGTFYANTDLYYSEHEDATYRPECFEGLGVPFSASAEEVRLAYRRLARQAHPDVGGDPEQFKRVRAWYEQAMAMVVG